MKSVDSKFKVKIQEISGKCIPNQVKTTVTFMYKVVGDKIMKLVDRKFEIKVQEISSNYILK